MSIPTQNQDKAQKRKALIIASVFLIGILANLIMSLSLGFQTGGWQQFARAGIVLVFGVLTVIAITRIRLGKVDDGLQLIVGGILLALAGTSLLLAGFGLMLGILELLLAGGVAIISLPKEKMNRSLLFTVIAAILTYVLDFLPLDYRIPAPATMTTALPIIAIFVVIVIAAMMILMNRDTLNQFIQSSIRNRLTTIVVGAAIIPVLLVSLFLGWVTYVQIRNALTADAFDKLSAVQSIKANQITTYLTRSQNDMGALSETVSSLLDESLAKMNAINILKRDQIIQLFQGWDADVRDVAADPGVVTGMRDMSSSFQDIGADKVRALYLGQVDLQIAEDGSSYSLVHQEQHGFFTGYIAIHGYTDAFLIDAAGNVVYSVQKRDAFGTNLVSGAYSDSNLAHLYQKLLAAPAGKAQIADIASFQNENAMFIGSPIYDGSTLAGMLVYQLPLNTISSIMAERTGQGVTGDSYLLALEEDGRITYRSDRTIVGSGQFVIGYDLTDIAPQFMRDALNGKTGGELVIGSVGEAVINAYRPLGIEGLNWAVLARITAAEALSPTHSSTDKDFLTGYKESYGYYDIFLIEPKGTIFYTVLKEADYRTNILTGEYSGTNLGDLVQRISKTKNFDFVDFASYAPSGGIPAAFFGVPVLDADNNIIMIVVAQVSVDQIGAITSESTGLGETGETYLVGQDQLWRNDSRFLADLGAGTTVLNENFKVDTVASRSALAGESGQQAINDYRGIPVLSVWSPIIVKKPDATDTQGLTWALLAEVDETEALATINQLAGTLGLVIGLAVLGIGALAVFLGTRFATQFVTPIISLTNTATQVAAGNMNLMVKVGSKDEIGTLSNAFNSMTSQLRELIGSLEGRVAARTKDLATVAEVGTATSSILDTNKLLKEVVELTKERFNLYHSHIYLLDEKGENLILTAGAGEPGRIMAAEKRSIPLNREQSLVARAARERKGVTVNDVTQAPDFLPNPLLPNTRSELAAPMIVGETLVGVFDIQSDQVGRFAESDVNIQTTLASQVATSIQNSRSYERSKEQADLETLVNAIGQKIQRATTVEDTLQTAIREIGLALGAARVSANIQASHVGDKTNVN